jgi:HAMP domain-containing protein/uncharacterized protein YecT (DUF1311 family)
MRRMAPLYWGAAAAVLLVVAAGGWFAWRNTNAPQTSVVSAVDSVAAIPAEASPPALPPPAQQAATNETNSPAAPAPVAAAPQPAAPPIEQRPAVPNRQVTEAPLPPQAPPSPAFKPSFDCATAKTDAERLVCGDSQLSTLDVEMATLFQKGLGAVADANAFNGEQLDWLTRRDVCSNKQCLLVSYNERIKELERWVAR